MLCHCTFKTLSLTINFFVLAITIIAIILQALSGFYLTRLEVDIPVLVVSFLLILVILIGGFGDYEWILIAGSFLRFVIAATWYIVVAIHQNATGRQG